MSQVAKHYARIVTSGKLYKPKKPVYKNDKPKTYNKNFSRKRAESISFYESKAWLELRYKALLMHGRKCMCCGAKPGNGVTLHVDHVKPRSKYPSLSLELSNLQVLCDKCNIGKGAWDQTDFRKKE